MYCYFYITGISTSNNSLKASSSGYSINMGGGKVTLPIPDDWVDMASDHLIQCTPTGYDSYVTVNYSNSFIELDDKESIEEQLKSLEDVTGHKGRLIEATLDGRSGYIIYLEDDGRNSIEIYEEAPNVSEHLEIRITDYDKAYELEDLVGDFSIDFD